MFGRALKPLREERHLSQAKLAERAGFDHSYVSRLESGERRPTRSAVASLAAAMKLDGAGFDTLLAAAGFLPNDPVMLLADEPAVAAILQLLGDETVSIQYRNNVRAVLHTLTTCAPREATYPLS